MDFSVKFFIRKHEKDLKLVCRKYDSAFRKRSSLKSLRRADTRVHVEGTFCSDMLQRQRTYVHTEATCSRDAWRGRVAAQASQTHDSRNRSNFNDLCTRIE